MAGRCLPRWLFCWLRRFFVRRPRPYVRPAVRPVQPNLLVLEERFSASAFFLGTSLGLGGGAAAVALDSALPPPPADSGSKSEPERVTDTERIQLIAWAPTAKPNEEFVYRSQAWQQEQPPLPRAADANVDALDTLFSAVTPRRAPATANPVYPGNNTANAQANGGGGVPAGASTPNAGGGGGGGGSSGAGPAVTNANQFLSAYFNMLGSALTPATHTAATPAVSAVPVAAASGQPSGGSVSTAPAQTPANAPAPTAPFTPSKKQHDPLYVLDVNTGETVPANVTLNTFSKWSEDLWAQVSGATVSSYSWSTTNAPDLTGITGATTANLQGTWATFTGAARTDTITVTETAVGGAQLSQTMTFLVAGSDSPGYSTNRPTSSTTWPAAITPDLLMASQATADGGPYASLGLADGSVQTVFAMPDYNPNTAPVSLLYNSTTANAQPIFLAEYQLPTGQSVPATITAQLTFNGTPGSTVYYNTSSLNAGDWVQIALQASATSLSTGRYSYQITVTNGTNTNYSGSVDIVNRSSSAFGSGWSLGGVEQIVSVTGGVILVEPGGSSLWFANGSQAGTFVTPAGDFSTLTQNTQNNTYQRTLPDGTQINFTSGGLQTSVVDRDGNTTSYSYSGSQLTAITDLNSQQTTLAYNASGKLTSITDPAGRAATLAYNASGQLTSITDPASAAWQYGYDSSNRLTTLTDPRTNATTFSYDFAGRVTGVTRPDSTTASLVPLQINGLATPGTGTSGNPATAVLLATGDQAQYTDPASNVWTTGLDWLGFGKDVRNADPLSDTSLIYRDSNGLPWLSADPLGRRVREFFDSKGNATKVVAPDDTTQQYQYNSFSEPTQYTSQLNNLTTFSYNAKGDLTQVTDALNHLTTLAYNSAGLVTSTIDPLNHTTTKAYDSLNRLTKVTDALSDVTTSAYDSASNVTATTDARGFTSTFSYDLMGRQTGATRQAGTGVYATSTVAYDKVGNSTSMTDPLNHTSTVGYDAMNRPTATTDALGHQATFGYDSRGNKTAVTDALHRQTTFGYDAANRLTAATDPAGDQTTYGYDVASEKTISTDPLGRQTTFSYTQKGQVSVVTDPAGAQLSYGYDAAGNETGVTEVAASQGLSPGQSASVTMAYNSLGQETATTDQLGNQTTFGVDADGNVTSSTDALGHQATFAYDALNRLTQTTDALGHQWTRGYDARSQLTSVTDALTHQTTYGYDGLGRRTAVTDARGGQTTFGYDLADNLTSLTDSVGNQTTYGHDAANRLTSTTDPSGHAATLAYDVANQLTSTTDRDGRTKTMAYDVAGRLTNVTWVSGSYTATYTYDKDGEVTEAQDPSSQYTMTYNVAGLVKSVDNGGTPGVPHVSLTMAYDGFLNRTSVTDSLGGSLAFGYDLAHKITSDTLSLSGAWKAQVTMGYDAASRLTGITRTAPRSDNIASSLGYDNANRLTNITHQDASFGTTLASYTYGYDNANRLTSYQDGNSSLTYGYDNANELTGASGTLNGSSFAATYSYDLNGNRTMTGYSTGTGNELKSDGTYSYTYDNEGNLTTQTTIASGSVTYYSYDYRNLLTEVVVKNSGGTVLNDEKFTYDIHGNRIGVSLNGTQQSYSVFDGANPYIDFNGSGTLTERYLTNPQALSQFYARVNASGTVNWYLTDNVQSVRQIVDAVGTVQDKLVYDPFGSIVSETNAVNGDRFKYTGGQYDSVTGNDQFGARAYGSWSGRFWSQDPEGFKAGDADLYRYVFNGPLDMTDPSGLIAIGLTLKPGPVIDSFVFGSRWTAAQIAAFKENYAAMQDLAAALGPPTDWFQDLANWGAGFGDTVSFGLTKWARQKDGYDDVVDYGSGAYRYGVGTGRAYHAATALAGGVGAVNGIRVIGSGLGVAEAAGAGGVTIVNGSAVLQGGIATVGGVTASGAGELGLYYSYRGGDLPAKGPPNSSAAKDYGNGKGQIRDYGPDGRAIKDFDFGHDHHGVGDPHVHDWDWSKTPARQPPRPIKPGE